MTKSSTAETNGRLFHLDKPLCPDLPEAGLFLIVDKLEEPTAHLWSLFLSPDGSPPPPEGIKRVLSLGSATLQSIETALERYPCDNVEIFTPQGFSEAVDELESFFRKKAHERVTYADEPSTGSSN
jgi:hypothetical protein